MKFARRGEADRLRRQMHQSAAERYADHYGDIAELIALLRRELRTHRREALREPNDWGFAGDLGRVRRSLKDVLLFLIVPRFESEGEASQFIEDHLEAARHQGE